MNFGQFILDSLNFTNFHEYFLNLGVQLIVGVRTPVKLDHQINKVGEVLHPRACKVVKVVVDQVEKEFVLLRSLVLIEIDRQGMDPDVGIVGHYPFAKRVLQILVDDLKESTPRDQENFSQ